MDDSSIGLSQGEIMKVKDEPLFQKRENVRDLTCTNGSIWNALFPGEAPSLGEAARRFFDNLGIPIAILDRDLNFVYGNHSFSEVFGVFPDRSSGGRRFPAMFRRLNHDGFESWWAEIQWFDYRQFDGIFEFTAADGLSRVYKVIFSRHEDGAYYTATFINITAEERQRNHLRKRLGHARSLLAWLTRLGQARDAQSLFQEFCTFAKDDWRIQSAVWISLDWASQRLYKQFEWKNGEVVVEHANHPWSDRLLPWLQEMPSFRLCSLDELRTHGLDGRWLPDEQSRAVVLPLRRDGHLHGFVLATGGDSLDAVPPEEMRLIGVHLQMAFDHVQLFEENRRFQRLLQQRLDSSQPSAALHADLNTLADRIGRQLGELTQCRAAMVAVFKDGAVELARSVGLEAEPAAVLPDWSPEKWESRLRDGQPLVLTGIADSPEFSESGRRLFQEMRVGTLAAMAERADDDRLVVVAGFFGDPPPDAFTLDLFATQALYGVRSVIGALMIRSLKHSRDFMEGILKHSAYAIICTDRYGRITYYSQGAKQMLGYSEDEVIGREVSEFWLENPAQIRQMLRNIGEHDRILDYETYLKHQNGQYIPFSLSLAALYDDSGRISGYLGIGRDISEKKKAEEELQQRREELEDLIYLITHNLKSPIVSVEGFANLLIEEAGSRLDEESFKYLDRIKKNVESMNTMISDLLEFSKYGKMDMVLERVDLQQLVRDLIEEIQVQFAPVNVQVEIPEPLPEVVAHGEGIKTVFENLLNNAAKYRKPDQDVHIKIWFEKQPRFFAFHIEDDGIGIEPEAQKKIFNLFQRAANAADIHGTGVGLAICKRIVMRQGGFITVHSTPGEGTRFSFTLPKRDLEAEKAAADRQADEGRI